MPPALGKGSTLSLFAAGRIISNGDITTDSRTIVNQNVNFTGGVDLATRTEVYKVAQATRDSAIAGIQEANRRRG